LHRDLKTENGRLQNRLDGLLEEARANAAQVHDLQHQMAILQAADTLATAELAQLRDRQAAMVASLTAVTQALGETRDELVRGPQDAATLAAPLNPVQMHCVTFVTTVDPVTGAVTITVRDLGCLHIMSQSTWDGIVAAARSAGRRARCWCRHEVTSVVSLTGWGTDPTNLPGTEAMHQAVELLQSIIDQEHAAAPEPAPEPAPVADDVILLDGPLAVAAPEEAVDDFMIVGPAFIDLVSDDDDVMGILGGYNSA
jgi:hypothetical protein